MTRALPVVYACSGSTSAGELADHAARELDRTGLAEMASIAGIGADDPQQLSRACSRYPVIVIDGCANGCARRCLEARGIEAAYHYVLSRHGVGRRPRERFTPEEAERVVALLRKDLA
jgi:uncharacterized metal-binding protein